MNGCYGKIYFYKIKTSVQIKFIRNNFVLNQFIKMINGDEKINEEITKIESNKASPHVKALETSMLNYDEQKLTNLVIEKLELRKLKIN
jgi:hypothetical protein